MIRCGIHEANITPALGMEIPGYFETRLADGVRDELFAEAVYFDSGDSRAVSRAVLISCDAIQIPLESCDRVRSVLAERLGAAPENILVCATHSHTAGPVETWGDFVHLNPDYMRFLENRMIDGACLAAQGAREVRLSFASETEDRIAYYRDYVSPDGTYRTWGGEGYVPFGEIDPEVGVLRINAADGTPYGVIVNYACHCDCVGGSSYSSDYPGEMRRALRRLYGESFMPVFVNGFCGNINHVDPKGFHREVPEHYKRMGRMLAADASRAFELAVRPFEDESVAGAMTVLEIPSRVPDASHLAFADQAEKNPDAGIMDRFYAQEIRRTDAEGVKTLPVPVQVLRVGEAAFFGMPGEIFAEFGRMLKERSPIPHAMPVNLANGAYGYVPTRELVQPGIYEASVGMSNRLDIEAGYRMTDELIRLAEAICH